MLAAAGVTITCLTDVLVPGASTTCAGEYTITQANVDAGSVVNVATAIGTEPGGEPVESPSDEVTVETGTGTTPSPPLAVDDTATTPEGTPVDVVVLANDSGDQIVVTAVTQPANGTVSINPDGTVRYTPNPSFVGVDTFTYTITDVNGATSTATVTVTIEPAARTVPDPSDPATPTAPTPGLPDAGPGPTPTSPESPPPSVPNTAASLPATPERAVGTTLGVGFLLAAVAVAYRRTRCAASARQSRADPSRIEGAS